MREGDTGALCREAVVLAGGLGTRLRPAIGSRQKVVATVGRRPFVHLIFDQLRNAGVRRIVLAVGFQADEVQELLGDSYLGVRLTYSVEGESAGTGGALAIARSQLTEQQVLVMNGDSIIDADIRGFANTAKTCGAPVSLLMAAVDDCSSYGRVVCREDGAIEAFEEKGEYSGEGWVNAGVYFFTAEALDELPDVYPSSLERDVFPSWIGRGLRGITSNGELYDIGTPERLAKAQAVFAGRENR